MPDDSPSPSPIPKEIADSGKYIELSREQFESIPLKRGQYILTYFIVFAAWGVATLTQFYYEVEQVPLTAEERAAMQQANAGERAEPSENDTAEVPETRVVYRWKWTVPVIAYQIALGVGMVFFYTRFIGVLRLMGYPWPIVVGYCSATLLPLPGVLAVAYFDRQIAKSWNKAERQLIARDHALRKATESGED